MVYYTNCFCCKSRIGAKILAILGFIFSSLVFFTIVVGYGLLYGELHGLRTRNQFGPLVQEIVTLLDGYIDAVFAIIFVFCLFWITSCILLLLGINMKQKNFFLPWLILHMIGFIVSKNNFLILRIDTNLNFSVVRNWYFGACNYLYSIHSKRTFNTCCLLHQWFDFGVSILLLGCGIFSL